ncbi:MAG: hypothetical protein EXR71_02955 [Myxococcales bacterium]|nr:hypothetical protein [Myxococcales bacterium]
MATLRVELLRRERAGTFPCLVRTADGKVLRLHGDAAPRHARWFGMHEGVAVWSEPAESAGVGAGEFLELHLTELVDEVGVALGPDRDHAGLLDAPGESSLTGERTGTSTEEAGVETQRTAVLAWIAASLGETHDLPDRGAPCVPLRARIADEPPDLLPSLGSAPTRRESRVLRAPPHPAAPDLDDSVTQVDLLPSPVVGADATAMTTTGLGRWGWFTAERVVRLAPWFAVLVLSASAVAWSVWALPA